MSSGKKKHGAFLRFFRSLFIRDTEERKRNRLINKKIKQDRVHQVLILCGAEGSGKSTLFNQIRLMQGEEFDQKFRYLARNQIRKYVRDVIITILTEMRSQRPLVLLHSLQNEAMATLLLQWAELDIIQFYKIYLPCLQHCITTLWRDKAIQETVEKSEIRNRIYNFEYFIEEFVRIFGPHFLPTDEDILRCPFKSITSVRELDIQHGFFQNLKVKIVDFDGSLHKLRTKRIPHPLSRENDADFIFVVDCGSFNNLTVTGDPLENKLRESFRLLNSLSTYCCNPDVVILNKQDLLKEKIQSGIKFEDYFPEFEIFPIDSNGTLSEISDVERINRFIKMKCTEATSIDRSLGRPRGSLRPVFDFVPICAFHESDIRKCLEVYFNVPPRGIDIYPFIPLL